LDEAPHGVIYFSMGYIFDTSAWTNEWIINLFSAFSRLPQRIIMKLDKVPSVHIPSNIMIRPYLQQQDVLAHNNTIIFFTHFGGSGLFESIWHGVPMVGIPIMIDQIDHGHMVNDRKIGIALSKHATGEEIYNAIVRVRDSKQ
jgi:UDP:flavonoid glycosyltransferase YjiC (YdhE family)